MNKRMDRRIKDRLGRHVMRDALATALAGWKYYLLVGVLTLFLCEALFGIQGWSAADAQYRMAVICLYGSMLVVLPLLYGRMRIKKRLAPGAFSVKGLAAYAPVLAAVGVGGLLGVAADIVQKGSLQPLAQLAEFWQVVSAAIVALFIAMVNEGRMIACLKERGYAHEEIVRMLAGLMLFVIVANLLLTLANGGSLNMVDFGISGLNGLLLVVLCGRVALRSGRLTEVFVLRLMLQLTNGSGRLPAAQAVQIAGLAAAILLLERIPAKTA